MEYTILQNGKAIAEVDGEGLAGTVFIALVNQLCGAGESLSLRYNGGGGK